MSDFFVTIGSWLGAISFFATVILGIVLIAGKLLKKQFQKPKKAFFISLAGLGLSVLLVFISFLVYDNNESDSEPSKQTSAQNHNKEKDTSNSEKPITKEQYQNIKIGMTNNEVEKILGKVAKDSVLDLGSKYEWQYSTKDVGLAYIDFDKKTNKVVEKSEIGVLSDGSTTVTDKNGTRNNDSLNSSNDETEKISNRKDEIQSTIENIINKDFMFDTSLKKFELNENMGTNNPNDYVALIYLSYDQIHSVKTTKKWIYKYTSHLAATLAKKEPDITSLSIFWETPRFKKDWNTAKFNLTRQGDNFYFDSENYDESVFK
ncbi:hypothetical protein ABE402_06030 [Bacillus smithii]|uniref:hypothetical protein n=1 Tax=Bacillus smithii TaxID=1479 RepID=UPI003D24749E